MKDVEQLLKSHGLRSTENRRDILTVFRRQGAAVSHHDIESQLDEIDRITLYRTLKSFEKNGLIHKVVDGTNVHKYALCEDDCDSQNHHHAHPHFHCEKCDNTFCVDQIDIPEVSAPQGFRVSSAELILNGICDKCN